MKTLLAGTAHGLIFGVAVMLTGTTAQAGLYEHIDDHSHDIEREAERAEAIVKHNFRHAPVPITRYLQEGLCGVSQSAHRLHELTKCSGNLMAIDALTSQLESQFIEVQEGALALREWATGRNCSVRRFSSCFHSCRPRSVDRANIASLDRRLDDISEELCDMKKDLDKVLAAFHCDRHSRNRHLSSHRSSSHRSWHDRDFRSDRHISPLGRFERPGHDFSGHRDTSRSNPVSHRHDSSHGPGRFNVDRRDSGHSRHFDSSYIHTRIGGFGLSFRLR